MKIFFADSSLKIGDKISQEIISAIQRSNIFLVFYSVNSISSNYVQQEIGIAKAGNKIIIPLLLDGTKPTAMLTDIKYLDLSNEEVYKIGINKLYQYLYSHVEKHMRNEGLLVLGALGILAYLAFGKEK
ncbi:MAG: toll/interleukin-1 receptor domain-containing protein [Chloroflexi bacterium]|nr:toll/interleukin-1 receptor domain-containing protein [Chloroflexota bacterium]